MTIYSITYFIQELDFSLTIKNLSSFPSIKLYPKGDVYTPTNYAIAFQSGDLAKFIYSDPKELEISLLENLYREIMKKKIEII